MTEAAGHPFHDRLRVFLTGWSRGAAESPPNDRLQRSLDVHRMRRGVAAILDPASMEGEEGYGPHG